MVDMIRFLVAGQGRLLDVCMCLTCSTRRMNFAEALRSTGGNVFWGGAKDHWWYAFNYIETTCFPVRFHKRFAFQIKHFFRKDDRKLQDECVSSQTT